MVVAVAVLSVFGLSAFLFRRFPRLLVVPDDTEWVVLLVRLFVGGAATYVILALVVHGIGSIAVIATGHSVAGDMAEGIGFLALWLPLPALPLSASVTAWWWTCRSR
jgi:hypothetical protein